MSKMTPNKNVTQIYTFSKSTFTVTFAIEILGMDVWHDCNEGWLDLGPYHQAMKIQYQLYPGQNYDLDILIWPHVVKIWCASQFGYVRTWQFLERRWFTFSIRHAFVARVLDLKNHTATVTCSLGGSNLSNNAKNDKNVEAYLPPLKFGERRYFGSVLEKEKTFEEIIYDLLWNLIEIHIPASYLDGVFDTPTNVKDVRHQDAVLYKVQEEILKKDTPSERESLTESETIINPERRKSKLVKGKEKKNPTEVRKEKFSIYLSGDSILAGSGRITMFDSNGERPPGQSNTIVLVSSKNLPSYDDLPIIFVNIEKIYDLPMEQLKKERISQIYTRWIIGDEEHNSRKQDIKSPKPINFNDRHTVPLQLSKAFEITTAFLDDPFVIQLRGVRQPKLIYNKPIFFGQEIKCDFNPISSNISMDNQDVLIATTKIDLSHLANGNNALVRGEFPLFPPKVSVLYGSRKTCCTNYMNSIGLEIKPDIVIQSSIVLQAQMTLETTIGLVGCKGKKNVQGYSRLYCLTCNSQAVNAILMEISKINEHSLSSKDLNSILTGFVLDTRDEVIFYIEGPKNGEILKIWELMKAFYTKVLVHFSCPEQHLLRIYPSTKLWSTNMPFNILRTYTTVNSLLGCPQAYVKPTLPIPARTALLKIGRLIASKLKIAPCKSEMPTNEELESFKLELCVPFLFGSNT